MELDSFSIFLTAADELNFTRAAEKLYMTQQNLSAHIKRLERIYGVELFQRKPVLRLTPAGETMVFFAKQMLQSEKAMTSRFTDLSSDAKGVLHLGMSHQRCAVFFADIWNLYHEGHENISIRLHEQLTEDLVDLLVTGKIDIMTGLDIPTLPAIEQIPLSQETLRCMMNDNLLREYFPNDWESRLLRYQNEGVSLLELKDMPMLILPMTTRIRSSLEHLFAQNHVMPPIALESMSHTMLIQIASAGGGVGILNPPSIFEYMREGKQLPADCHIFKIHDLPDYTISLAYRKDYIYPTYIVDMMNAIQGEYEVYNKLLAELNI